MINDDILIKFALKRIKEGHTEFNNWVDYVRMLSFQIREIRDHDFIGIGMNDLELLDSSCVGIGERVILSDSLDFNNGGTTNAAILGEITRVSPDNPRIVELLVDGIGRGSDFDRDPDRRLVWGKLIYPDLSNYPTLLRLSSKPRSDGGSVYYFFNKAPRDSRVNWVPGFPDLSRRAILGTLRNTAVEDLNGPRERAQHMHTYRRVSKEIVRYLEERPDPFLSGLLEDIRKATKQTSKNISKKIWEKLKEEGSCI